MQHFLFLRAVDHKSEYHQGVYETPTWSIEVQETYNWKIMQHFAFAARRIVFLFQFELPELVTQEIFSSSQVVPLG